MEDENLKQSLPVLRRALEVFWGEWAEEREQPAAADGVAMCRFTSAFLVEVLGLRWRVAGGDPTYKGGTGGFFDGIAWRGHYWVTNGSVIVDLTANQFGAQTIVLTDCQDPRYQANYNPLEISEAMYEVEDRVDDWAGRYLVATGANAQ